MLIDLRVSLSDAEIRSPQAAALLQAVAQLRDYSPTLDYDVDVSNDDPEQVQAELAAMDRVRDRKLAEASIQDAPAAGTEPVAEEPAVADVQVKPKRTRKPKAAPEPVEQVVEEPTVEVEAVQREDETAPTPKNEVATEPAIADELDPFAAPAEEAPKPKSEPEVVADDEGTTRLVMDDPYAGKTFREIFEEIGADEEYDRVRKLDEKTVMLEIRDVLAGESVFGLRFFRTHLLTPETKSLSMVSPEIRAQFLAVVRAHEKRAILA